MLETVLLVFYAIASIGVAIWVRRTFKQRIDWSDASMRQPVGGPVGHVLGTGALGSAEAVSTAALSGATPGIVMMSIVAICGLFGGFLGAGVLPAFAGGITTPTFAGMLALAVATLAWTYIGGRLALPALMFAFAAAPVLIGIGVVGFGIAFFASNGSGNPGPNWFGDGGWKAGFESRMDYNLCAAGTSLISMGSLTEIGRKCRLKVVGTHPVEGRFAGVYSCGGGRRITAIVEIHPFGPYRDGLKDAELQFSDKPQEVFPLGAFAGFIRPDKKSSDFRSDGLKWTQNPGNGWGMPPQLVITPQPSGALKVQLAGTPCTTFEAKRCQPDVAGKFASCSKELASMRG
nr:hypothetical protein [uncultured Albidiferax sp.]